MNLKVQRIHDDAALPAYAHFTDAGADLTVVEEVTLYPDESADVPTGLQIELPIGLWGLIHGRSSTLRKLELYVNPGIIDNGYRGPLFVYVRNIGKKPVTVMPGDRLAQLILLPYVQPVIVEVDQLEASDRGSNGFGSTGLRGAIVIDG